MNKYLLLGLALSSTLTSFAQLNGDGFYRLQNYKTERYAYVVNNYGKINMATTSADLSSIELWSSFDKAACDPSTIIYLRKVGESYDIEAQGTTLSQMIGHYLKIKNNNDGTYKAYAEQSGTVLYLGDNEISSSADGFLATNAKGNYRDWYIKPLKQDDGYYFGIKPDIQVGNKYYKAIYTSFSYSFAGSSMKAYYISKIGNTEVGFKEITTEIIPGGTPVYIECSSANTASNKVNILETAGSKITDNKLTGVYFNFDSASETKRNQVEYDAETMRVFGVTSTGELGFVTANLETLPANSCYLTVPAGSPAEMPIVAEENISGITNVTVDASNATFDIYSISGTLVRRNATSTDNLPAGIYVAKGRKIVVLP